MSMFTATIPVDFVGKELYNEEILINKRLDLLLEIYNNKDDFEILYREI